jgi:hypothetical protein
LTQCFDESTTPLLCPQRAAKLFDWLHSPRAFPQVPLLM